MYKKTISILLLFAIFITLVRFTLPYFWYYSNYQYISTELCINIEHPELDCNGSCQLERMIQKQHDHSNQKPVKTEKKHQIDMFFSKRLLPLTARDSLLNTFRTKAAEFHSIWINEPATPPPKAG